MEKPQTKELDLRGIGWFLILAFAIAWLLGPDVARRAGPKLAVGHALLRREFRPGHSHLCRRTLDQPGARGSQGHRPAVRRARKPAWEEEVRRRSVEIHGDGRAHELFVGARWNIYEYPDPMDKPSTLPEQLGWLEEAGFEGVDVFWARAGHALLGGYRPVAA